MRAVLSGCEVRPWLEADVGSLTLHANNHAIWRNLRDGFPHPYQEANARAYIRQVREQQPETTFAIDVDGAAVGSIGLMIGNDVERVSAELGYWLGEPFWGRGIVTECVRAVSAYAIAKLGLTRVFALPFAGNGASCRVLEKAGFTLEARLRKSAIKEGRVTDQFLYAFVVGEGE
jgi:[ribosomal protein S5]-alanine N-acetyltransferase